MHNWDYPKDDEALQKNATWYFERLQTYGTAGEKIDRDLLERHFKDLMIPEDTRAFFELLLWSKPF